MPSMTNHRGLLIAVEGCDRGGKTTQCKLIQEWLQAQYSIQSEYMKFPERSTPIGKIINEYLTGTAQLNDQVIHLLFSCNRWELKDELEGKLAAGMTVILDRYAPSGVAYSSAKGLDLNWCKMPDHGLPKPDLVIFLDVPIEGESSNRDGFGEERYEKVDFQIKFVDGTGNISQVSDKIKHCVTPRINQLLDSLNPLEHFSW